MSNLTDFFPSGGGGGLTPKFQEFNSSGTFTPTQALIDAGGYIEVFLVGGGQSGNNALSNGPGGAGGEVIIKSMYLVDTYNVPVTIGSGGVGNQAAGSNSVFDASFNNGINLIALGGVGTNIYSSRLGAGFGSVSQTAAGSGTLGFGVGGNVAYGTGNGMGTPKANSGSGSSTGAQAGSGYCLIKWYE